MRKCDDCPNLAQWAMLWVTRFSLSDEEKKKRLIQKGPEFKPAGFYCTAHKLKREQIPIPTERTFRFIGATVGSHTS